MGKFAKKYEASRIFKVSLSDDTELTLKNYPNKFQKRLLAATVSEDQSLIYKEILNVLNESILEPENFDLYSVPYFDVHKVFLALVSNSYQNKLSVNIRCGHESEVLITDEEGNEKLETKVCDASVKTTVNLDLVEVHEISDLIYETPDFNVIFKYPNFEEYILFVEKLSTLDPAEKFVAMAELVQKCLIEVEDEEGKEKFESLDKDDQSFIIDSLPANVLSKAAVDLIKPYIAVQIPFICPECGHKKKVELKGIDNFFR